MQLSLSLRFFYRNPIDIKTLYRQLPYIVYRGKYLIPNKPFKPLNAYMLKKQLQKKLKNASSGVKPSDLDQPNLQHQAQSNYKKYCDQINRYRENYLQPLKVSYKSGYLLFRTRIDKQIPKQNIEGRSLQETTLKVAKLWNQMSQTQKQKWNKLAQYQKERFVDRIKQFNKKHLIPKSGVVRPIAIYSMENKANYQNFKFESKFFDSYRQLPEEKIKLYKETAKKMTSQNKLQYQQFLDYWNISDEKFNYYKNISFRYEKYVRQKKNEKKRNKNAKGLEPSVQGEQQQRSEDADEDFDEQIKKKEG